MFRYITSPTTFNRFQKCFILNNRYFSTTITNVESTPTYKFLKNKQDNVNKHLQIVTLPTKDDSSPSLSVSKISINTDNFTQYQPEHKAMLISAIKKGFNVIYSTYNSPTISTALDDLMDSDEITRDDIVVIKRSSPITKLSDLTPESIEKQIQTARDQINLKTLDTFLISIELESVEVDIYLSLKSVFNHLEKLVDKGWINGYGISSSLFLSKDQLSLETILDSCLADKNNSHFKCIEYPFNLYNHQAITKKQYHHNNQLISLQQYARLNSIYTINSSPTLFKTSSTGVIGRFQSVPDHSNQDLQKLIKDSFDVTIHLETINPIFKEPSFQPILEKNPDLIGSLQWGHILVYERNNPVLSNLWQWKQILSSKIKPAVYEAIIQVFSSHQLNSWGTGYKNAINELFDIHTKLLESEIFDRQRDLDTLIGNEPYFKGNNKELSLFQKSILASLSGSDIIVEEPQSMDHLKELLEVPITDKLPLNETEGNDESNNAIFTNVQTFIDKHY
eukprot:gene6781-8413_t